MQKEKRPVFGCGRDRIGVRTDCSRFLKRVCTVRCTSLSRNLWVVSGIIPGKRDVSVLSTKRSPGIIETPLLRYVPETSHTEDAFSRLLSLDEYGMKLRGHKKFLREICDKVDLDLGSPTCRRLREHLSSCPFCSAYYDSMKMTLLLYREYDVKLSHTHVKRILARLETSAIEAPRRGRQTRLKAK